MKDGMGDLAKESDMNKESSSQPNKVSESVKMDDVITSISDFDTNKSNERKSNNLDSSQLTKKEKAQEAAYDATESFVRGYVHLKGGQALGKAVDMYLDTKMGQHALRKNSDKIARMPGVKGGLARSHEKIKQNKPLIDSAINNYAASKNVGKPNIANPTTNKTNNANDKKSGFFSDNSKSNDNSGDTTTEHQRSSLSLKNLWNFLGSKLKVFIIGSAISFFFTMVFIIIIISPIVVDDNNSSSGSGNSGVGSGSAYVPVSGNSTHWWPIGSSETTEFNGALFASGETDIIYITSNFESSEDFRNSSHKGIDIGNGGNGAGVVNVIATKDGTVVYPTSSELISFEDNGTASDGGGYGNYVIIRHDDGSTTLYGHLSKNTITVMAGDTVIQGQVIGKMGNSGHSFGVHLHYEVIVNGQKVDPNGFVNGGNQRPKSKHDGKIQYVSGSSVKQSICLSLLSSGFSSNSVAALLTNINAESSFDPKNAGDYENGIPTSYGLCQWHNERKSNLINAYPGSYDTVESQLDYLFYELEEISSYKSVYNELLEGSKSASDLTYDFCYYFEIPENRKTTCTTRGESSNDFLTYVNQGCN